MRWLLATTVDLVTRTGTKVVVLRSPRTRVGRISVAVFGDDHAVGANTLHRLVAAIDLIRDVSPRTFRRMQREVRRVIVEDLPAFAFFQPATRTIFVDRALISRGPMATAVLLVHEATHARIAHAGIRSVPQNNLQIERRCIREQIAFAARLPGGAPLVEWSVNGLSALSDPDSADEVKAALREQRYRGLREPGVPAWLVQLCRKHRLYDEM